MATDGQLTLESEGHVAQVPETGLLDAFVQRSRDRLEEIVRHQVQE